MTNEKFVCPVYKKCGGCQLDVTYKQQLSYKQRTAIKMLGRYARVSEIVGMDEPLGYRCKVSSAFGFSRGHAIYGVWQSSSGRLVQVDKCALEDVRAAKIVEAIRILLPKFMLRTYDEESGKGFLRFVTIRIGKKSGEILVALGTGDGKFQGKLDFAKALKERCPEITTIVQNVSTSHLNLLLGEKESVLVGKGYITDNLCGYDFRISARSFFQINPTQTEKLYSAAVEFASLSGEALREAISKSIREKGDNLVGNMASQGTTPRQLTDLIGSLCDLTSGSGDKGTPVVLIRGYFDNYTT